MKEILKKLDKMADALDRYEDGKPLPISLHDINFIIGVCRKLIERIDKAEESYKTDMVKMNEQVTKWRDNFNNSAQAMKRLDTKVHTYQQVVKYVEKLPWWRKTKALKSELSKLKRS